MSTTAIVLTDGTITQLDGKGGPPEVVNPDDVADDKKLAQLLERMLRAIAKLERMWKPRRLYFRDVSVDATGTTKYRFEHGFGGRVNWRVEHWDANSAGVEVRLDQHADTDDTTLVLVSGAVGSVTVGVEEAG